MARCRRPRPTRWFCPECKAIVKTKKHKPGAPIPVCTGWHWEGEVCRILRVGDRTHRACEMRGL